MMQALKEAARDLVEDGVGVMKKDVLLIKSASRSAAKRWLPAPWRRPLV